MDMQKFLTKFGHIVNAPNGLSRLKEIILFLALTGKLTKNTLDETKNISKELDIIKKELIDYKKENNYESDFLKFNYNNSEYKSICPNNWKLIPLSDIAVLIRGVSYKKHLVTDKAREKHTGILRANNINGELNYSDLVFVPNDLVSKEQYLKKGDILIALSSGSKSLVGKSAIYYSDSKYSFGAFCGVLRCMPSVNYDFIYLVMQSPFYKNYVAKQSKGIGINNLTKRHIKNFTFCIPSLRQQQNIVRKVNQLISFCNKIEKQQQKRRDLQNKLRKSILQSLVRSNKDSFKKAFDLFANHSKLLYQFPEDIKDFRNCILDLTIRGLLVEQNDKEQSSLELIKNIEIKKQKLLNQKLIAKQTLFKPITKEEYPFSIPKNWSFVRLGVITNKIGSGRTPRGGSNVYLSAGIPFLRSQNIWNDGLHLDDVAYISSETHTKMSSTSVENQDILLNITGASLGRCALVPQYLEQANISQHVTIIRLTEPQIREYLHFCILSPYIQELIWQRQVGMAREGLSKKVLEQFEIPLPPLAEQKQIVKKVSYLMKLCDELENKLAHSISAAEKLTTTIVANITGITFILEEIALKTPQTELIAPVKLTKKPSDNIKGKAPLATLLIQNNKQLSAKDLWQRSGLAIDAFYAQLKYETDKGWIKPEIAEMLVKEA